MNHSPLSDLTSPNFHSALTNFTKQEELEHALTSIFCHQIESNQTEGKLLSCLHQKVSSLRTSSYEKKVSSLNQVLYQIGNPCLKKTPLINPENKKFSFNHIPIEILQEIIPYLDIKDIPSLLNVEKFFQQPNIFMFILNNFMSELPCKTVLAFALQAGKILRKIEFKNGNLRHGDLKKLITACPNLQIMKFEELFLINRDLEVISKQSNLLSLYIKQSTYGASQMKFLIGLSQLQSLTFISNQSFDCEDFGHLRKLQELQSLTLGLIRCDEKKGPIFSLLKDPPKLESLTLINVDYLQIWMPQLGNLSNLKSLSICDHTYFDHTIFQTHISTLHQLEFLEIDIKAFINDESLNQIAKLKKLKFLYLKTYGLSNEQGLNQLKQELPLLKVKITIYSEHYLKPFFGQIDNPRLQYLQNIL